MFKSSCLLLCSTLPVDFTITQTPNHYASSIKYQELYQIECLPNKNTMEYNVLTTEELVRQQNIKILNEIFKKELEDEHMQHNR